MTEKDLLTDLTLQGIVGIEDPVRDQVGCSLFLLYLSDSMRAVIG